MFTYKEVELLSSGHACVSIPLLFLVTSAMLNMAADRRMQSRDSNFDSILFKQQNALFKLKEIS